ncbi:testicular spindle-associated protein SHCBP1L-like isoform X1 [Gadus macrocephalus]|uniref:testicular spindle-associated protein SHCBP1L-like isoform X1 n=1 Tax=Gadus macrocephalus TaxID=80720 RepID=UPI0028CB1AE4|nr:testicular spindle-associated protein SHCBP1L-like isoform X1 [Gadus macrocephalus]
MEASKYYKAMEESTNSPVIDDPTDEEDSSADYSPQIVRRKTPFNRTKVANNKSDEEVTEKLHAKALPHIFTSDKSYSYDDRVSFYCDQIIGKCSAEDVGEALGVYLTGKLSRPTGSWKAVWRTVPDVLLEDCDYGELEFVGVLVEVTWRPGKVTVYPQQVSVSVTEPFSSNITNLPRKLVGALLLELGHKVTVLEVYPIQNQGKEVEEIAEALEQLRFFYDSLWRDWVDVKQGEEYAERIEKRLRLYYDMQEAFPGEMAQSYQQTLEEYNTKQAEMSVYQASLPGEPQPREAVECWRKYYEMTMLAGFLKFWEDTRPGSSGLSRIYKRRRGERTSGMPVTHIVAQMMTAAMVKSFSSDTLIHQHDSLSGALDACFSGDTVVLVPGQYQAHGLSTLTDDITIRGAGEQREVVLTSQPGQPCLVVSNAARVKLSNLRLQQEPLREAAGVLVVVEAGEMTLDGCELQGGVTGVCVHTGATLLMRSCEVSGAQGAAVELSPGSVAELSGNEIHHCSNKEKHGAISLKILPKPRLTMSDNHIHDNQGYGIAIVVADNLQPPVPRSEPTDLTASGDQGTPEHLAQVLQELGLEVQSNKLDENQLGGIHLLHHSGSST